MSRRSQPRRDLRGARELVAALRGTRTKRVSAMVRVRNEQEFLASIGSGQITITFGDSGESHTATLDISAASIYVGHSSATATASSASALSVGDRVYAVLSVSSEIASGDVRSGTPIPVSKLYDAGAPTPPTGG